MAKSNKPAATGEAKACAVTREQFKKGAKPVLVTIAGQQVVANVKEFDSGTFGWFTNGSTIVDVDGTPVKVTFQVQMYVPHSKDAK